LLVLDKKTGLSFAHFSLSRFPNQRWQQISKVAFSERASFVANHDALFFAAVAMTLYFGTAACARCSISRSGSHIFYFLAAHLFSLST
jgi:hypothetical protein